MSCMYVLTTVESRNLSYCTSSVRHIALSSALTATRVVDLDIYLLPKADSCVQVILYIVYT